MCQGFSHFLVVIASFCIGQLVNSSIRVNIDEECAGGVLLHERVLNELI